MGRYPRDAPSFQVPKPEGLHIFSPSSLSDYGGGGVLPPLSHSGSRTPSPRYPARPHLVSELAPPGEGSPPSTVSRVLWSSKHYSQRQLDTRPRGLWLRQEGEEDLLVHLATHPATDPLTPPATHAPTRPPTQHTDAPTHPTARPGTNPPTQPPPPPRCPPSVRPSIYPFACSGLAQHPPCLTVRWSQRYECTALCLPLGTDTDTGTDAYKTHQGCRHPSGTKLNQQAQAQQGPVVPCSHPSPKLGLGPS